MSLERRSAPGIPAGLIAAGARGTLPGGDRNGNSE